MFVFGHFMHLHYMSFEDLTTVDDIERSTLLFGAWDTLQYLGIG